MSSSATKSATGDTDASTHADLVKMIKAHPSYDEIPQAWIDYAEKHLAAAKGCVSVIYPNRRALNHDFWPTSFFMLEESDLYEQYVMPYEDPENV